MADVDIVLPSGQAATVPEQDLERAIAAGAKVAAPVAPVNDDPAGGALGQAAAGIFGAGSSATLGVTDRVLREGSYVLGGEDLQRKVLGEVSRVREANPTATMVGEGAGLFLNPAGVSGVGEAIEGAAAKRLAPGLLGSVGSFAARGAAEGVALGAQHELTEETLKGDPELNGQKIFASAAKDALLGGAVGGVLGAGGHYLGEAFGLLRKTRGPASDAALDEIAGVAGAGRQLHAESRATETLVEDLRKTGLTTDQAAQIATDVGNLAKERVASGPASGLVDGMADMYAAKAGGASERAELIRRKYAEGVDKVLKHEEALDQSAQKMARKGTQAMRDLEDTLNEVNFKQKPEQMAKLVDAGRLDVQRDAVSGMLQHADDTLKFWESTAAKGGSEGAIKSLRKTWTDVLDKLAKVDELGGASASKDLFIGMDKFKRQVDSFAQWGRDYGLPEAVMHEQAGIRQLGDKLRAGLEDEGIWGQAGAAQRDWNEAFSTAKARRDDFGRQLGVTIDQQRGVSLPEVDIEKARGLLSKLRGSEFDADVQGVKSTEAFIDGLRNRASKILEHGELSEAQRAKVATGLKSLDEFAATFAESRKEAALINRLKAAQTEEQGKGIGGMLGLVTDAFSKPLTTMDRLAQVRTTAARVEEGVAKGLERFFGQKGEALVEKLSLRPRADVAKEIGEIKQLAGNPVALQDRISKMVGDLGDYAPKTANEVKATAQRAIYYLAKEAPRAAVPLTLLTTHKPEPRYSDTQIASWETKRKAVLGAADGTTAPESIIVDMKRGKLNRDAIQAIEFVSPALFRQMQEMAWAEIQRMDQRGLLDKMPYQQWAAIATLLKVPPDGTWKPDFMAMMQAAKAMPAPEPAPPPGAPANGTSKRAIKINTDIFATEAAAIEQGMVT